MKKQSSQTVMLDDGEEKGIFEMAMEKYIKEQCKPTPVSVSIIMRPCAIITAVFLVMFVIFLITQAKGFDNMRVT
jgi:hypothetical protein